MPELIEQSTPPPVPPLPIIPDIPPTPAPDASSEEEPPEIVAVPPLVDPDQWEDYAIYRETFLVYFTEPRDNTALRDQGRLTYNMALEYYQHWPDQPEGWTRSHLRAAVADLRHLEGFLATMGENPPEHHPHEAHLCHMADRMARKVGSVAEQIEEELGSWRGEAS